jgi:hypothetical protein
MEEKKGRAHFSSFKTLELLARDWSKSTAGLAQLANSRRHHLSFNNLETHLPTAITQPHPAPRGLTTSQHDVSTDTAAVHATMYKLPPPYHRS